MVGHVDRHGAACKTGNETASKDARSSANNTETLHDKSNKKHAHIGDDGIFSGRASRSRIWNRGTQTTLRARRWRSPSLFCLLVHPDVHVAAKRGHGEDRREDTLVVSIDKTSNASKTGNRKDLDIPGATLRGR